MAKQTVDELIRQLRTTNPDLAEQLAAEAAVVPPMLGREECRLIAGLTYPTIRRLITKEIISPTIPSPNRGATDRWEPIDVGRVALVGGLARFLQRQDPATDSALTDLWRVSATPADTYYVSLVGDGYLVDVEPSTNPVQLTVSGILAVIARELAEQWLALMQVGDPAGARALIGGAA